MSMRQTILTLLGKSRHSRRATRTPRSRAPKRNGRVHGACLYIPNCATHRIEQSSAWILTDGPTFARRKGLVRFTLLHGLQFNDVIRTCPKKIRAHKKHRKLVVGPDVWPVDAVSDYGLDSRKMGFRDRQSPMGSAYVAC